MTSLKKQKHWLSDAQKQLEIINTDSGVPDFWQRLADSGLHPLTATGIEVFQVNLGKMCNMTCEHCHVDAGPDRREIMSRETMQACLDALIQTDIPTVDMTGGAPEMNPNFQWFVEAIKRMDRHIMVRSNLTILMTKKYASYPEFFRENRIEVISSLPCYTASNTDKQRGQGVFDKSVAALRRLNELGYGQPDTGLVLNLVYNPLGASLPPCQTALEADYKRELKDNFGIVFNKLFTITNMPISRFLVYLIRSGRYDEYMQRLHDAYNPKAASNVMCRNTLSIGWDGSMYDCDFNQMLNLTVDHGAPKHICDFDMAQLNQRQIVIGQHCYGCTAGAGSSCGGAVVNDG